MRQKDEIRWRKRINNYGQKVNWMGQQHVFWTKYNVKGIWRRRVCCWQERNAVASIWKKGYSTPWGKRLWHTRAEQHACPGTASVEFQRQIFIRASSLPACPALQPERPHDCFSQATVSALTLPACLWAVVTWCLLVFRIFFGNAFLIKAMLCFSNLPLEAGYTCKVLLVILKHIVCKPSEGRR